MGYPRRTGVAVPRISGHGRYYDPPPQSVAELRAIAFVEAQLGEPLRRMGLLLEWNLILCLQVLLVLPLVSPTLVGVSGF